MPKSTELSEFECGRVIGMWEAGLSEREIEKKTEHKKTTVHDTIARYRDEGRVKSLSRTGRPVIASVRDKRSLVKIVKKNRAHSLLDVTDKFNEMSNLSVSSSTVHRYLHELGYYGRVGVRKPLISEKNRRDRLAWCHLRKKWVDEWNLIIWSDESRFEIFQSDSHHYVWRKPQEKYNIDCLIPTVKHGGDGVMVWGCFVNNRLGPLIEVDGRITGLKYREILEENLIPFLDSLGDQLTYLFQDDNAPAHTAKDTIKWKDEHSISCIEWPAQSPDLNPIEHLWDVLERKVRERKPHPRNKKELFVVLKEEWMKINPEVVKNLVDSMPRRVKAVIDHDGNPTRY